MAPKDNLGRGTLRLLLIFFMMVVVLFVLTATPVCNGISKNLIIYQFQMYFLCVTVLVYRYS